MTFFEQASHVKYHQGMFDQFKSLNLSVWEDVGNFSELMVNLGFKMDCGQSFDTYCIKTNLQLKEAHTEREKRRNKLYLLEHASVSIVGNYLFSEYRYYTHWAYMYTDYDVDYLLRIIAILEKKYAEQ